MKNWTQRLNFFLVVWLTMFSSISAMAQNFFKIPETPVFSGYKLLEPINFGKDKQVALLSVIPSGKPVPGLHQDPLYYSKSGVSTLQATYHQPADLYYINSGYFCKREWELEKTTHIPFRFRIGSLADCDALERKH